MGWIDYISACEDAKTRGELVEAENHLQEGVQAFPEEMWLRYHLAAFASVQRDWTTAATRWFDFQGLFPDRRDGLLMLASALIETGAITDADATADRAIRIHGPDVEFLEIKARIREKWMEWDAATYYWLMAHQLRSGRHVSEVISYDFPQYKVDLDRSAFGYWHNRDHGCPPSAALWRHIFGSDRYKIIGDAEVSAIIASLRPDFVPIYHRIRIPACKADVARIAYLITNGGLYLDMHVSMGNVEALPQFLERMAHREAVFLSFPVANGEHVVGNSIILARPQAKIMLLIFERIVQNLTAQFEAEKMNGGFLPYNIFSLSGPSVISGMLDEYRNKELLKETFEVFKISMRRHLDPFHPFYFYSYRRSGNHWSERQHTEPLFF